MTIMWMDKGLDTGDILLQETVNAAPARNGGDRCTIASAKLGAELG